MLMPTPPNDQGNGRESALARIDTINRQENTPSGYVLRRIIISSYWLYPEVQEFFLAHGRLVFVGNNESGKSTSQSAALISLTGSTRSEHLDPKGEKGKVVGDFVFGKPGPGHPAQFNERTSYLALEFAWCNSEHPPISPPARQKWFAGDHSSNHLLTVGVGLHGTSHFEEMVEPFYFLVTDGTRLIDDFPLILPSASGTSRLRSRSELKAWVKDHGILCKRLSDYQNEIATHLFGFTSSSQLHLLMELLFDLRKPNVVESISLEKVFAYLKKSLPSLSFRTSNAFIETVNRIEQHRLTIREGETRLHSARELHAFQHQVILSTVKYVAFSYLQSCGALHSEQSLLDRYRNELATLEQQHIETNQQIQRLWERLQQVEGTLQALEHLHPQRAGKDLEAVQKAYDEAKEQKERNEVILLQQSQSIREKQSLCSKLEISFREEKRQILSSLQILEEQAKTILFWETAAFQAQEATTILSEITVSSSQAESSLESISRLLELHWSERLTWLSELAQLHDKQQFIATDINERQQQERYCQQEIDQEQTMLLQKHIAFQEAITLIKSTIEHLLSNTFPQDQLSHPDLTEVFQEEDEVSSLPRAEHLSQTIQTNKERYEAYARLLPWLESCLAQKRRENTTQLSETEQQWRNCSSRLVALRQEHAMKVAEDEFSPSLAPHRRHARDILQQQNIPAQPLYRLIRFAPHLDRFSTQAVDLEQTLSDVGFLDALVIPPEYLMEAERLLTAEGLRDCYFHLNHEWYKDLSLTASDEMWLLECLQFDENNTDSSQLQATWQKLIPALLASLSRILHNRSCSVRPVSPSSHRKNSWTYGALLGYTSTQEKACCIGRTNRIATRQEEVQHLSRICSALEEERQTLQEQKSFQEKMNSVYEDNEKHLATLLLTSGVSSALADLRRSEQSLEKKWQQYEVARTHTRNVCQRHTQIHKELEQASQGITVFQNEKNAIKQAIQTLHNWEQQFPRLRARLEETKRCSHDYHHIQTDIHLLDGQYRQQNDNYRILIDQFHQKEAAFHELAKRQHHHSSDVFSQQEHTLQEKKRLTDDHRTHEQQQSCILPQLTITKRMVSDQEQKVNQHQETVQNNQEQFTRLLTLYPGEPFHHALELLRQDNIVDAASSFFDSPPVLDPGSPWNERLRQERDEQNAQFQTRWLEHGPHVQRYEPSVHPYSGVPLIVFTHPHRCQLSGLVDFLTDDLEKQRLILSEAEKELFEHFFVEGMIEQIHLLIAQSHIWVASMNEALKTMCLGTKYFQLSWVPLPRGASSQSEDRLAHHTDLLSLGPELLSEPQKEILFQAFRNEIAQVRNQTVQRTHQPFEEFVQTMFDYREWFTFHLLLKEPNRPAVRVTPVYLHSFSSGVRLLSLCIPLFAALSALYNTAAPGAPRLFFLDEAFPIVDLPNMRTVLDFLAKHHFQWLIAGQRLSLVGTHIPAYSRYVLKRHPEKPLATGMLRIWQQGQPNSETGKESNQEEGHSS